MGMTVREIRDTLKDMPDWPIRNGRTREEFKMTSSFFLKCLENSDPDYKTNTRSIAIYHDMVTDQEWIEFYAAEDEDKQV